LRESKLVVTRLCKRRLADSVLLGCAVVMCGCSMAASGAAVHMAGTDHTLRQALRQPADWYGTEEGRRLADIVLSWQNANGGWWKKYDVTRPRPAEVPAPSETDGLPGDTEGAWRPVSTIDNDATYDEMCILARAYAACHDERYREAFERGLKFLLEAQYANGGWPQRFPLQENYGREITFNDGAMVNVMTLLRDVAAGDGVYGFVGKEERERCRKAFEKGVECTLACQVKVGGKLAAWCQQYDPVTLVPAGARAYELPGLTACESAGITLMLMRIDRPDDRVVRAVEAAVTWYRENEITGKRVETVTGPQYPNGRDRVLVDDPGAPPMWARFYDIETGRPFFVSRDGVKRGSVGEISWERRNGYAWYGNWGQKVLDAYPAWKRRVEVGR
jgi:PelA/Pel-15E family pectate lyase